MGTGREGRSPLGGTAPFCQVCIDSSITWASNEALDEASQMVAPHGSMQLITTHPMALNAEGSQAPLQQLWSCHLHVSLQGGLCWPIRRCTIVNFNHQTFPARLLPKNIKY
ncbi:hypothetical protein cyc_02484 [Cyclospora cayetanensis]|uniref:Uncharacterized protein n=1 Tax=Cyclospora cayetanensis TaxID=88456 RepID=A0A1D3D3Z4_9EIME|nr:hypothetical protein cyc_02484 [Cyclospora cayetanensis]